MKKMLVLVAMAALLAPATAMAYEVVVPYFVDDQILEYPGGTNVIQQGWATFIKVVNLSGDQLVLGVRYTDVDGLPATPAGNTFMIEPYSGWPFRPCQDIRPEEGNKVAPLTPLMNGDPDPTDPNDSRYARGPRGPLGVEDQDGDGIEDEDGEQTSFSDDQHNKGALALFVVSGLDPGWDAETDGPPIAVMMETYAVNDKYANATSSITGGIVGPTGL